MKLWFTFWYWAMAGGLFLFAAIAVTVGFGAFRDIHSMLQRLRERRPQDDPPSPQS